MISKYLLFIELDEIERATNLNYGTFKGLTQQMLLLLGLIKVKIIK